MASLTRRDLVSVPDCDEQRHLGATTQVAHICDGMQRGGAAPGLCSLSAFSSWELLHTSDGRTDRKE